MNIWIRKTDGDLINSRYLLATYLLAFQGKVTFYASLGENYGPDEAQSMMLADCRDQTEAEAARNHFILCLEADRLCDLPLFLKGVRRKAAQAAEPALAPADEQIGRLTITFIAPPDPFNDGDKPVEETSVYEVTLRAAKELVNRKLFDQENIVKAVFEIAGDDGNQWEGQIYPESTPAPTFPSASQTTTQGSLQ